MLTPLSSTACAVILGLTSATPLTPRATSGCGTKHNAGFNDDAANHSFIWDGRNRTYAVNVPSSYNSDLTKHWPLILDYHGNNGNATQQYFNSQYYKYSAGKDYLVVYPNAFNGSWQSAHYPNKTVEDDLGFTTALVQLIREKHCIDDTRIYASGKSNGGGFVDYLACHDNGDEFSAFAMAAPALYSDLSENACSNKRAILQSHGDFDGTIPYHPTEPGSGGPLPDIDAWVSWWGHRTCGSGATANNSKDLGGYNTTTYSCGNYTDVISHYQIFKLGHCWPSGDSSNWDASDRYNQSERHCLDKTLDFTSNVLDFFGKWNKGNIPKN